MINTQTKQLELKIAEAINESGVNIATVALILEKFTREANMILAQAISEEQKQVEEKETKEEETEKVEAEIVE